MQSAVYIDKVLQETRPADLPLSSRDAATAHTYLTARASHSGSAGRRSRAGSHDEVVGIAHDEHIARGLALSPACGPKVEHVVKIDIGEERRDHRTLPCSIFTCRDDPVFK